MITSAPERTTRVWEALDMALAFSAFEQPVEILFDGDGVRNLVASTGSESIDRTIAGVIASFPLYEIAWFASATSAHQRQLQAQITAAGTPLLSAEEQRDRIAAAREVLVF